MSVGPVSFAPCFKPLRGAESAAVTMPIELRNCLNLTTIDGFQAPSSPSPSTAVTSSRGKL